MLLGKCASVLALDVLQIDSHTYVDTKYVSTFLANLVKSGHFSNMLSCIQKSTEPASVSCASSSHSCNWIHPIGKIAHSCDFLLPDPLWISRERHVS